MSKFTAKKEYDDFDLVPQRVYSDAELKDFHSKIQRFYEPKTIQNPNAEDFGKTYDIFNHDDFAVAYGAYVKVLGSNGAYHYCIATKGDGKDGERAKEMVNLLTQHTDWIRKQDYFDNKNAEHYEKVVEEVAF